MKIQSFKRITKESIPKEYGQIVDTIGYSMNSFAEEIINALNNNLSIYDNLNMQIKQVETILDSSGLPINSLQYKTTINGRTKGIVVFRAENLTSDAFPTGAPFITYIENNNIITIQHITGLAANVKYRLTLLSTG